jgi:hypothetical protein
MENWRRLECQLHVKDKEGNPGSLVYIGVGLLLYTSWTRHECNVTCPGCFGHGSVGVVSSLWMKRRIYQAAPVLAVISVGRWYKAA